MIEGIDYKWVLAISSGFISVCNMLFYLSTVIKGKTSPHKYTWLIWGMVSVVVLAGQLSDNAGIGSLLMITATFNCFLIAVFAHFKGTKDITRFDKICLLICVMAIALWPITKMPLLSVLIVTFVDLVGYIPTIRKSYSKPQEENIITFTIFVFSTFMAILGLENHTLLTTLYLLVITIANIFLVLLLAVRRKQLGYKIFA